MKTRNASAVALLLPLLVMFGAAAIAQEGPSKEVDKLLPSGTLFYLGMDDFELMEKYAETMPITKIVHEEEVVDFLKKPKEYIDKKMAELKAMMGEDNKELAAKLESMMDLKLKRFFLGLTHLKLPAMDGSGGEFNPIPDVGLVVGLSLKGGVDPAPMLKGLLDGIAAEEGMELSYQDQKYNDVAYTRLTCPHAPYVPIFYFHIGDLFVVTLSEKTMKSMVDCSTGASKDCLANSKAYTKLNNAFGLESAGSSQAFLDMKEGVSLLKQAVTMGLMASGSMEHVGKVEVVADKLGLDSLGYMFERGLSKDGVARSETLITWEGEYKGLLEVFPCIPIEKEDLKAIPKEVVDFSIFRFDLAVLYDLVMDVIQIVDKEVYQGVEGGIQGFSMALTMGTEKQPINLREDIIGQLGNTAMYYTMGGGGGMGMMMPSMSFFVEIKDYDRFVGALKTIFEGLSNLNPEIANQVSMSTISFNDQDIHYFQFAEIPMMITPCFTKAGNYLAVGMQIDDLKKLIKRQGAMGESVLDNKDFANLYKMLPEDSDLLSISYNRTKESFSSGYNQLAMMIPMATMAIPPEFELPLDLQLLPTAECIDQYLFSSLNAQVLVDEHTAKIITYGPFGGECLKYLFPVVQLGGFMAMDYMMKDLERTPGFDVTNEFEEEVAVVDEGQFKVEQTRADMVNLSNGCFVYKIEFGEYPAGLEDLLKPTKDWPSGFYTEEKLPKDPWGNAYLYKKLNEEGKNYMIWSAGPNCMDENGEGDDIKKIK